MALISHASKVMLKIPQLMLQQYVSREFPDVQARFRKGRGTRDQITNIHWITEKARKFQKNIVSLTTQKPLTVWIPTNCGKILQEIPDHLTCVLRNLDADQEKTVRIRHETSDWFKIRKKVHQGCILSPYLFKLYAASIMQNARLDEA